MPPKEFVSQYLAVDYNCVDGVGLLDLGPAELDPHAAPTLKEAVEYAVDDPEASSVVVELGEIRFIDSSGLRVLVGGMRAAETADKKFIIRNPQEPIRRFLEITGMDEYVTIEEVNE